MKTSDFYYDLPQELIAQTPVEPRDSSRLMVVNRKNNTIEHKQYYRQLKSRRLPYSKRFKGFAGQNIRYTLNRCKS